MTTPLQLYLYSKATAIRDGHFVNFSFQSSIGLKKRVLEYSGVGHVRGAGHGRNWDNTNI